MANESIRALIYEAEIFEPWGDFLGYTLDQLAIEVPDLLNYRAEEVEAEVRVLEREGFVRLEPSDATVPNPYVFSTSAGRLGREVWLQSNGLRAACLSKQLDFQIEDLVVALLAARTECMQNHNSLCVARWHLPIYLNARSDEVEPALVRLIADGHAREFPESDQRSANGKGAAITSKGLRWYRFSVRDRLGIRNSQCVLDTPTDVVDLRPIDSAVWIIESTEDLQDINEYSQGTCFGLAGVGFVTCAHALRGAMVAFHPSNIAKKYRVAVVASDPDLDIAIIDFEPDPPSFMLPRAPKGIPEVMRKVLLAGYPKYAPGKNANFVEGAVTSTFVESATRRFSISAHIIEGNSGGPVLDDQGRVLGVAYLGGRNAKEARQTDRHGVVPIGAIDSIRRRVGHWSLTVSRGLGGLLTSIQAHLTIRNRRRP